MTRKRKNNNKWWYWLGMLVVVGLVATGAYLMTRPEDEEGYGGAGDISIDVDEVQETTDEDLPEETDEVKKEETVQYEGETPNDKEELSGVVTFAGVNNGKLMIRINIDQYLETGTCDLTLKRGDVTIYNSRANIIGVATTATCEGFDVPLDGLGEGKVKIDVKIKSKNKEGLIQGEAEI